MYVFPKNTPHLMTCSTLPYALPYLTLTYLTLPYMYLTLTLSYLTLYVPYAVI